MDSAAPRPQLPEPPAGALGDLLATVPARIVQLDRAGRIVYVNQIVDGLDAAAVLGSLAINWVAPSSQAVFRQALDRVMAVPVTLEIEVEGFGAGGKFQPYLTSMRGIWHEGTCSGAYLVTTEQSERIAAQRALRASEARLRAAADSLPFPFWVRDANNVLVVQNAESLAQWGDQLGKSVRDLPIPPELLTMTEGNIAACHAGEVVRADITAATALGPRYLQSIMAPVRDGDEIIGVLGLDLDLTEQRRLEAQLSRAAREESVGRLAGGVAHDFNNLLTAILGYAELGLNHATEPARVTQALERILEAGRRGAAMTNQLLAYARSQPVALQALDPCGLIERVGRLIAPLLGRRISFATDFAPETPQVIADSTTLEQVLVNVAVNARDAMPDGGDLCISTAVVDLTTADLSGHKEAVPGRFVRIAVRDSGTGMSAETLACLFEPFFTTKPVGKGTGLGLASSRGLVRQHHGVIRIQSEVGRGTTVTLDIPAAVGRGKSDESAVHLAVRGTGQRILLAEDDPSIRELVSLALRELGYVVATASDGGDALVQWEGLPQPADLIITDLLMPTMGGREWVSELRKRGVQVPVLYVSGYRGDSDPLLLQMTAEASPGMVAKMPQAREDFLPKPFTTAQLAQAVRNLLEAVPR